MSEPNPFGRPPTAKQIAELFAPRLPTPEDEEALLAKTLKLVAIKYGGMAFITLGEKIHGELSKKAEALSMSACAVKGLNVVRCYGSPLAMLYLAYPRGHSI